MYNIVADLGEIQNLTVQAAGIGNNLNQIARYFHGGGLASRGMLEELKKCIAEIRELRQEIVQLGGVYRGKYSANSSNPERTNTLYKTKSQPWSFLRKTRADPFLPYYSYFV